MKFFGLEMTPPLPSFWTFFPKFTTKIYRFKTKKVCNVIFWIGNDPPPPLRKFSKKTSSLGNPVTPYEAMCSGQTSCGDSSSRLCRNRASLLSIPTLSTTRCRLESFVRDDSFAPPPATSESTTAFVMLVSSKLSEVDSVDGPSVFSPSMESSSIVAKPLSKVGSCSKLRFASSPF